MRTPVGRNRMRKAGVTVTDGYRTNVHASTFPSKQAAGMAGRHGWPRVLDVAAGRPTEVAL